MNLLVGATGFVGGHLVEYLFQQGEISKGIFRKGSHLKIMDTNGVQGIEADILDRESLHEAMEGVDTIYSLASPNPNDGADFTKTNTEGIMNLIAAAGADVKTFVHLSTLDVYGFGSRSIFPGDSFKPSNEYQSSKAEAERLLMEYSKGKALPRIAVIRAAKAIGSRDGSLAVPILQMIEDRRVVLPSTAAMSFSHPRDIAQALYKAATGQSPTGSSYLVKSFDSTPEEIARGVASALGREVEVRKQGLLAGTTLPKYTSSQLKASARIDVQPSWKELGYAPEYDLRRTCEEIASWYKKEPWVVES